MTRKWRGVCACCGVDLYRDPALHYSSASHQDRAAVWERAMQRAEGNAESNFARERRRDHEGRAIEASQR